MTLIEVLIALGLLSGVLISVASLFVLGGQHVKRGRMMTKATAIASDIQEELHGLGVTQLNEIFPTCTAATGCTVSTLADSYASAEWQPLIDESLYQGRAEITLTPIGGPVSPPDFTSREGIRIRIEIHWSEGTNARSIAQETLRF